MVHHQDSPRLVNIHRGFGSNCAPNHKREIFLWPSRAPIYILHCLDTTAQTGTSRQQAIKDLSWISFLFLLRPVKYCKGDTDNISDPFPNPRHPVPRQFHCWNYPQWVQYSPDVGVTRIYVPYDELYKDDRYSSVQ